MKLLLLLLLLLALLLPLPSTTTATTIAMTLGFRVSDSAHCHFVWNWNRVYSGNSRKVIFYLCAYISSLSILKRPHFSDARITAVHSVARAESAEIDEGHCKHLAGKHWGLHAKTGFSNERAGDSTRQSYQCQHGAKAAFLDAKT